MIDPSTGTRRPVDWSSGHGIGAGSRGILSGAAVAPASIFGICCIFAFRHSSGNVGRITLAVVMIAPAVAGHAAHHQCPCQFRDPAHRARPACVLRARACRDRDRRWPAFRPWKALAMLRVEGLIDWKLQAAVIDRLLRLPASLFREYTVGDFVDRSMGIDAARRIFTGRALRGMMAGLFCWFSIGLMLYYDLRLGLIALALTLVRALLIIVDQRDTALSRDQALQPAGQDRRLRAAADRRHRQASRRGRDRSRTGGVVETVCDPEAVFRRFPAGPPTRSAFSRSSFPTDRHPDHLRGGRHSEEQAVAGCRRLSRLLRRVRTIDGHRSARGPRASAKR